MKSFVVLAIGLVWLEIVNAQDYGFDNLHYGINIYQSATGSGYGSSMDVNVNVQKYNRVLEVGLMLNANSQKIKGFGFTYKHFLGFHSANFYRKSFRPYFHYNFLYRIPANVITAPSSVNSANFDYSGMDGKMTTFEHAIGFGSQLKLLKQLYAEGNIGLGAYFGSHYQGLTPHSWGIHLNNYGFIPSFKLGFGYQF